MAGTPFVELLLAVVLVLGISLYQSFRLYGAGSDHQVHVFLARVIGEQGHRLLTRIPRLLTEAYCSAYPIFLHWLLSFLSPGAVDVVGVMLNPVMNALVVAGTFAFVVHGANAAALAGIASVLLALTPQYFHVSSARNYGLSSRPIGIVLLTAFLALGELRGGTSPSVSVFVAATIVGYLIWGFNTFAQQAMIFLAVILGVRVQAWGILATVLASLLLFILLHFRYAMSYLRHTLAYLRAYAREIAPIFILHYRYSIWRDVVYDIWRNVRASVPKGILYAYNNGALIVFFLNPLVVMGAVLALIPGAISDTFLRYCAEVSLAGVAVFFLTSLRPTRFLGEPERYVELVSPFGTIASAGFLLDRGRSDVLVLLLGYFIAADVTQFVLTYITRRRSSESARGLGDVGAAIKRHFRDEEVRFTSNNDQLAKAFMVNPWSFVRLWSCDTTYGSFRFTDAVTVFPFLRREPFEEVAVSCRANVLLLDRSHFDTVFEHRPDVASRLQLLFENSAYRLYRLRWSET